MPRKNPPKGYIRRRKVLSGREGPAIFKEAEDEIRTTAILLRLTPSEKATLKGIADEEDLTVIALLREMIRDSITT